MTSPLYPALRATAASLLTDKGQAMVLAKRTPGAYDAAVGGVTVTETTYNVTGAVFGYEARDIDGSLIKHGDSRVIVSALGLSVDITTTDTLTIGGAVHKIIEALPVSPAGVTVMWKVQARK